MSSTFSTILVFFVCILIFIDAVSAFFVVTFWCFYFIHVLDTRELRAHFLCISMAAFQRILSRLHRRPSFFPLFLGLLGVASAALFIVYLIVDPSTYSSEETIQIAAPVVGSLNVGNLVVSMYASVLLALHSA